MLPQRRGGGRRNVWLAGIQDMTIGETITDFERRNAILSVATDERRFCREAVRGEIVMECQAEL